jgi:hypothetical protein
MNRAFWRESNSPARLNFFKRKETVAGAAVASECANRSPMRATDHPCEPASTDDLTGSDGFPRERRNGGNGIFLISWLEIGGTRETLAGPGLISALALPNLNNSAK